MAKFFRRGVSKIHFVPTVANLAAPSRAEITAGDDISSAVAEISGFMLTNSPIPTPNLADEFTSQIGGEDTVADSSFMLYDDDTSETVRDALAKGTTGYVVLMPYGDTPTKRCEVWPVTVIGFNDEWTTGNDPARSNVGFAVTGVPEQDAVVPAAS